MWVMIMILLQGANGVATSSTYFADAQHCDAAIIDMQKAIKNTPSVTYLLHCAEALGDATTAQKEEQ